LWVAKNIPGLSPSHREAVRQRFGLTAAQLDAAAAAAAARYTRLEAARQDTPPFIESTDWMRLPLTGYPDFATWQPYLDEIITHPAPDDFRARHNFRHTIDIPGFHVTTWFDIFQTSVLAAFNDIQARVGNQKLWIGPNDHYFVYQANFWPYDRRCSTPPAPGSRTVPAMWQMTGAMRNAGHHRVPDRIDSICGAMAV
jgi:hypothetical protein